MPEPTKLKTPVVVWFNKDENQLYAFPLLDPWGGVAYPDIASGNWKEKWVLPRGTSVSKVQPDNGNRVRASIAGRSMYTAASALE
jgi:hypothetical protein